VRKDKGSSHSKNLVEKIKLTSGSEFSDMPFPLNSKSIDNIIHKNDIDLNLIGIRELQSLVSELSNKFSVDFLRFEFGIPGLKANSIGPKEEIKVLKENDALPSTYPPFDGIPRLKKATVEFVRQFLDIHVSPTNCIPTVGAMHGCFISQAIAGRRKEVSDTILFIDPGFPVNKLQTQFLGLKNMSIDLCDYRGEIMGEKLEEIFSAGKIGGLLWSSPNNPTWTCLTEAELEMIGKLLTKYDVIGIEDSAYFGMDFRYDYGKPGQPPFQPTIAKYTENYFIIISSSKIFSYAGQRVSVTISSETLMTRKYPYLKKYFNSKTIRTAFIHGGIYPTTAGVPQTPQHALAAFFETACTGEFDFLDSLKVYKVKAIKAKKIFLKNGFILAYPDDRGKPLGDGFYFTIQRENLTSGELLYIMLQFGIAGIPLDITGSKKKGVRICISLIQEEKFEELDKRVKALDKYLTSLKK